MLVIACGLKPVDAPAAAAAMRELLDSPLPAAVIDGVSIESASADLDRDAVLDVMADLIDRHEAMGPHAYIVTAPSSWAAEPDRLAFFLKRRRLQQAAIVRFDHERGDPPPATPLEPWAPPAPRIKTDRLRLTWPDHEQIEGYFADIVGTSIFDTLCWDGPSHVDELHDRQLYNRREFVRGEGHDACFGIIETSSDRQIGAVSFRPQGGTDRRADIGFVLSPHAHGKGLATEAVRAIVDFGFDQRGAERIEAEVFLGNAASRRVLEKAGFELEGVKRANHRKRGVLVDEWLMAITRDRWSD